LLPNQRREQLEPLPQRSVIPRPFLLPDFKHVPPSMTNVDANNPTTASAFCSQ
jgi:hypothetical protein